MTRCKDIMKKEQQRTHQQSIAFRKLRSVIPIHPQDTRAEKLSRIDVLRRAIRYILWLRMLLQMMDEGTVEKRSLV